MVYISSLYFGLDKLQVIYLLQMIYNLGRNANCTCGRASVSLSPMLTERHPFIRYSEDGEQLRGETKWQSDSLASQRDHMRGAGSVLLGLVWVSIPVCVCVCAHVCCVCVCALPQLIFWLFVQTGSYD